MFTKDIAIIGIGRVGLPLALSLSEIGFKVIGIDINHNTVELVNKGIMPFDESGCDELIKNVELRATTDIAEISSVNNIIITVGTPLMGHIETDLSQITKVINDILPHLQSGHNIILRSTVAPKTTEYVKKLIEQKTNFIFGHNIFLSFCPERIAEGKALKEIKELPQIIGCDDDKSFEKAESIFSKLTTDIFKTSYTSAELTKLFNNISRYINFAVANQFTIVAENYGENINEIIQMANYKYPRGGIPTPGLTAGTCLRKDFGMINESIPYTDLLLSAWKINEFMPKFLIDNLKGRTQIHNKNVAVLGYSFKNDTDDTRDSLVPKLIRYLQREVPNQIKIHDPYLNDVIDCIYPNYKIEESLESADVIYIATNHSIFINEKDKLIGMVGRDVWFVDLWNVLGTGKIFIKAGEMK